MALFFIFHATNIAILCYICVNVVLNIRRGDAFLKKWREFLGGGMKATFFLQKGKHPRRAERPSRAGRAEQIKEGRKEE